MSQEKKPSAFQRLMMNVTSVLGLPMYKNVRARQLGRVPPPACFNDERLDDSTVDSPSAVRRSYSLGSKDRDRNGKRTKHPRQWRRRVSDGHRATRRGERLRRSGREAGGLLRRCSSGCGLCSGQGGDVPVRLKSAGSLCVGRRLPFLSRCI